MVAVVAVCRHVRVYTSYPTAASLRGWIGGYLRGLPATVDGINAKNGPYCLVFNFFHALKKFTLGFGIELGSLIRQLNQMARFE